MDTFLPTFLEQFQHLKIKLEDIISATNNFDDQNNRIGDGGFGKVYKGELSHSKGRSIVAIKRHDSMGGQGIPEFLKEIMTLSRYSHENLISLLGFCYEEHEMILVYEHASRGSLDQHLRSAHLMWTQRLEICLDAAKGINYLHDPRETHQRLIHCDVKSANILLNDEWCAKVSDFGLSVMGPANEQQSVIVTLAAGTPGYCDPHYAMTHTLTKESDVYSFGVVLFEVLCGTSCCTYRNRRVEKNFVPTWIESYRRKTLNEIIFKSLKTQPVDQSSLETFSDIAYRCLKESREDRPKMAEIVTKLEAALSYQKAFDHEFQNFKISLEEITSATNNFDDEKNYIGGGAFVKLYKGELSHSKGRSMAAIKHLDPMHVQGIPEFWKEITMLSRYQHENVISLLGHCFEKDEMILVYEDASRGSLNHHLSSPHLKWTQRLNICLDAAKGLSYLHNPLMPRQGLIHCDVNSANILLNDQWCAKVSGLGLSVMDSTYEHHVNFAAGALGYHDPQIVATHTLTKESDIYSFGVVLFEVLCGTSCCTYRNGRVHQNLVPMWIESYKQRQLDNMMFKNLYTQPIDQVSLQTFTDLAYRCLKESREDRPKMADIVENLESALAHQKAFDHEFQGLQIPLKEITSATNNFDDENYIGECAFGKVYKGDVSHSKGRSMVAIKRLDRRYGQGTREIFKELTIVSRYRNENLITLLGFCYEEDEMILAYDYPSRGSLDFHLNSPHLTWTQRLKICLDAAKGLSYLHAYDPSKTQQRLIIHCDMKSANIFLDDQWNAKVSNFKLPAIMGLDNEQQLLTPEAGSQGYFDPQYAMTHTLTKESDTYDFGVVLLEVFCGTLSYTYVSGRVKQVLVPMWIVSYKQNILNGIIFESSTIQPLDQSSLKTFSDIIYRCLKESREDRPKMSEVVTELQSALEGQEFSDWELLFDYQEIIKNATRPLNYKSKFELRKVLANGVLLNNGKTWFSLNKKGEHYEMISFAECLDSSPSKFESTEWVETYESRFMDSYCYKNPNIKVELDGDSESRPFSLIMNRVFRAIIPKKVIGPEDRILKTRVKSKFLSPGITYTVNLVFKYGYLEFGYEECIFLHYKLPGETKPSVSYQAEKRDDGWYTCELYQFISDQKSIEIEILFDGYYDIHHDIRVQGIEFRPLEKVEHKDEKHPISDLDENWEENWPTDYENIMKWSTNNSVHWSKNKELYSFIRKGFLIKDGDGQKWFSLDKNGKKCLMISARHVGMVGMNEHMSSFPESRFGEALEQFDLTRSYIKFQMLHSKQVSPETNYAIYLVYRLPQNNSAYEGPIRVTNDYSSRFRLVYLVSPETPVFRPKAGQNTHNPLNRPKIKWLPQQRNDGWMEIQIWDIWVDEWINVNLTLTSPDYKMCFPVIFEGIEFRPI